MEMLEILAPPMFEPTGEKMTGTEAILAGKWLGSVNLWVYRFAENGPIEFLYQEREPHSPWMPGKLDVAAGGYYDYGEGASAKTKLVAALRELKGELGLEPTPERLRFITRRLAVGISQKGNERRVCCDIYAMKFSDTDRIRLTKDSKTGILEVTAIYWIGLHDIAQMHADSEVCMTISGVDAVGQVVTKKISAASFCPNYDDYLFTMPGLIAARAPER